MDLQTYLDNTLTLSRQKRLAESDQLTLGEMILKLEPICEKQKDGEEQAVVIFDFEYLFPVELISWRGIYAELSLTFSDGENGKAQAMKVKDFLTMLKDAVGKTFEGYKGGDFTMSKHTPVWVANYGNSGNTAVIDIIDDGYRVIIMTGYRES